MPNSKESHTGWAQVSTERGFKVKLKVCFAHVLVHYYTEIRAHHPNSVSALPSVML